MGLVQMLIEMAIRTDMAELVNGDATAIHPGPNFSHENLDLATCVRVLANNAANTRWNQNSARKKFEKTNVQLFIYNYFI